MKTKLKIHLALWVLFFVVAIPALAHAVDGQIKIAQTPSTTFPIVIDQPGSYVLTGNITVSTPGVHGIEITADNVTLDLNGHALVGPGKLTGGVEGGIYIWHMKNIAVKNGTVSNFGGYGIFLSGQNHQVKDIRAYGNGQHGIFAEYCIITNCTADSNGNAGISANYSTITNCSANNNGDYNGNGITGSLSIIINCTATYNNLSGIAGSSSIIKNCTSSNNGMHGIVCGYKSRAEGNSIRDNGGYGLNLGDSFSGYNYAIKNVASNNASGNFYASTYGGAINYMPLTGDNANYGF
jgi:hypothetical protein